MTRLWVGAALAIAAAVILLIMQTRTAPEALVPTAEIPGLAPAALEAGADAHAAASGGAAPTATLQGGSGAAGPADPQFQKWIAEEAKSLNYTNVDGERKQAEIKKVLKALTPAQSRQLLHTARNPEAASGEKILSTYLMVEGGLNTRAELLDFMKDDTGPAGEPHSEDEINGVRDKSLRIMAIDGLFAQAQKEPGARAALAREIPSIQDPYVKAYAQRKLEELDRSQQ